MKTHASYFWVFVFSGAFMAGAAIAQDVNSTVTIYATDAQAAEAWSDPGTFTVRRVGGTNFWQLIFYEPSGTASNGVDYEQLPGTIEMPAGMTAVSFTVRPINDSQVEENRQRLGPAHAIAAGLRHVRLRHWQPELSRQNRHDPGAGDGLDDEPRALLPHSERAVLLQDAIGVPAMTLCQPHLLQGNCRLGKHSGFDPWSRFCFECWR